MKKVTKSLKSLLAMMFFLGFITATTTPCGGETEGEGDDTEQTEEGEEEGGEE